MNGRNLARALFTTVITLGFLGAGVAQLCAQVSAAHPYSVRLWQTQNGLPEETVQAFAQTPDGFLWIGTTDGLLRFDGAHFVTFDRSNTPAFIESSVFSLLAGRDGTLWVGTEGGGLLRLRAGHFSHLGTREGLLDGFVRTILEDREGKVWVGTDNGLFVMNDANAARVTRVDDTPAIPPIAVHSLTQTRDGSVWVGGSRLMSLRGGTSKAYPLVGKYGETRVKSILQTSDGAVWVGTVSGLQRLNPAAARFERVPGLQGTVRTLCQTSDAGLWIGTIGEGAYRFHDGRVTPLDEDRIKLPSRTVLSIFQDGEKQIWMGTQAGMLRFSRSLVELVPLPHASDSDFETISTDRDGTLWVASTKLLHLTKGSAAPVDFAALHGARVRNVFRAADGSLWLGTDGSGLFCLRSGSQVRQYTTTNGLVNNFIRGILETRNGDLWVATDEGVSVLSHNGVQNITMRNGLAYFSVRAMLEDSAGGIWIGTDQGLSHIVSGDVQQDTATRALVAEKVWAIQQSASGALWFGTRNHGLYRYLPGEQRTTHYGNEQGLVSNSIYCILQDHIGRFWLSGGNGVEVVSISDLEAQAVDPAHHLSQSSFPVSESGELSPLYGGTQPAGGATADGQMWFPTSRGPVHFDTMQSIAHDTPRVFFDQVTADGRIESFEHDSIVLPAKNQTLEVAYGAILLGPQSAVQFQYRLLGFDRDWRFGSRQRTAVYTNLPAGNYTFVVRAFEDISGRSVDRSLTVRKRQFFYLTWWFLSTCGLGVLLCAWWGYRRHLLRVQQSFQAVLDERARLAREMHDTLIQGCAGVSLLLEACSADASNGEGPSELLDYARTQLAASIDEARQAVWNLREQRSPDFAAALGDLIERLDHEPQIKIAYEVIGEPYRFLALAEHEIAMAGREAIYNAVLHAHPTRIDVRAEFGVDEFELVVRDNGSGFESAEISPRGHYGLLGMQERMKQLGGRVRLTTVVHVGTTVRIQVPRAATLPNKAQNAQGSLNSKASVR